jgi:hypothetical protein
MNTNNKSDNLVPSERLGEHYNRYNPSNYLQSNIRTYDNNSYTNAYSSSYNKPLSVQQETQIEYEEVVKYISISSKDRDVNIYPSVSRYSINFHTELKNIISIELVQGMIPDKNNVLDEPYLLLKIDELDEVVISNDRNISDSFAILQLAEPTKTGGFIMIDKRIHEHTIKYFRTPKAALNKMTVTITDAYGTPFNFGNDSPDPPVKNLQNTFVFRAVVLEKKRNVLEHRNVF